VGGVGRELREPRGRSNTPGLRARRGVGADRSALDGVLGSVAGDDTVLVIADEKRGGMSLATEFRSLADSTTHSCDQDGK